jgi:hypothetical protein
MLSELKQQLIQNPIHIVNILEMYDFYHIDLKSKEIRCGISEDSNKTSISIRLINNDNLFVKDYGRDISYDLFNFIIKTRNVEFQHVMSTVKKELGISNFTYTKPKSIFGGFYDKVKSYKTYEKIQCNRFICVGFIFKRKN